MTWMNVSMLAATALVLLVLVMLWLQLRARNNGDDLARIAELIQRSSERLERALRDEMGRSASGTRQELLGGLAQFQQALSTGLQGSNQSLAAQALAAREAQDQAMRRLSMAVEQRLTAIQQDNEKKLEQMRATVDEKLHATLEQRLGESFKQVAERLEQVHKGLGEMQNLARDVGSLHRVLTNVKTRGIFGEVQLAGLLEQVFTPEQYAANVAATSGLNLPSACRASATTVSRCGCPSTPNFHARITSACSTRRSAPTRPGPRPRARPSSSGCAPRPRPSATNTSPHRTPPISPSSSCPPRGCMPRHCGGPAWSKPCSANTR